MKNIIRTLGIVGLCILWLQNAWAVTYYTSWFVNRSSEVVQLRVTFVDGSTKSFRIGIAGPAAVHQETLPTCVQSIRSDVGFNYDEHAGTELRTQCPSRRQETFVLHVVQGKKIITKK